jgi:dTDP-4-amino-4,6-dideoxygalactose transaminase
VARIFLSPPDVGATERELLLAAFDSNWIAPVGPDLTAFEAEFTAVAKMPHAVGVSSGTAGLHLLLVALGVGAGDEVIVSTFTFAASANAVVYTGATPVFLDSEETSWNLDPDLLLDLLETRRRAGNVPKALLCVDLYGQCADYQRIVRICDEFGLILIEDAAEALGATGTGPNGIEAPAGSFGRAAAFSFNGNKIITTSGGGMVVSTNGSLVERIRYLATQARQPVSHYEHTDIGYNYRLSNLLAALGRGQLMHLQEKIARRSAIKATYHQQLADLPGISFAPVAPWGRSNCWLSCVLIDKDVAGVDRHAVEKALAAEDVESRPLWKPMHRQPVFRDAERVVTGVSDGLFERGLCLPSGSNLSSDDQARVIGVLRGLWPS